MENLLNSIVECITQIVTIVSNFVLELFGIGSTAAPVSEAGEGVNMFLKFFENLIELVPVLLVVFLIFKLLSSGMQLFTKFISVLLLIALGYMILNGIIDIPALVNAGFNWN